MRFKKHDYRSVIISFVTFIMLLGSITLSLPTTADAATKVKQKYKPSYGIEYKKVDYTKGSAKGRVDIMEMDASDVFTEVQLGKADPLDSLVTVRNRANTYNKKNNKVMGAINANFFHNQERRPVHLISEDNRLVYKGFVNDSKNEFVNEPIAFGMDSNGKGLIDHYNLNLKYIFKGKTYNIKHTNRKRAKNNTVLYTSDFYKNNTDTNKDGTEVVLKGPKNPELTLGSTIELKVDSIRKKGDKKPIKISDNYFVLSGDGSKEGHGKASKRLAKMKVGDKVEIKVGIDKKWQGSEFMLAGGPQLVKNGKVNVSMNTNSWLANKAFTSRTAVGVDKSRDKVFFVTVDTSISDGMSINELAKLMKDLGADTALNLDGGGSTTMVVRPKGGGALKVANKLQDGSERGVSGILMAADTEPKRVFSDVSYRDSHAEGIHWLYDKGGITGYENNTFKVDQELRREHGAVIFTRALGLNKPSAKEVEALFDDVSADYDYAQEIAAVGLEEIFTGHDGSFLLNHTLNREQMATTIVNAFDLENDSSSHTKINMNKVDESHRESVQILADLGITTELDDFRPLEPVTRGQFASFLYRANQAVGQ